MTHASSVATYAMSAIEEKWQRYWHDHESFFVDTRTAPRPFYVLEMFPYPSGHLHMGHARNYTIGDVLARYKWAKGYSVLHPMGWDACGLPAENAALLHKTHPRTWTYKNAEVMKKQMQRLGCSHDWRKEIFSCDPQYFVHEQRMFLTLYKKGLAYQKEAYVNWDPVDHCVLANEQVIEGRGWRSGALVEKRSLRQWFLRITSMAEELLEGLQNLPHWPESVRHMQENWIGRSYGAHIDFPLHSAPCDVKDMGTLRVYTTKPETIFGVTFCAAAWDHPLIQACVRAQPNTPLAAFVQSLSQGCTAEAQLETQEKKGWDTGIRLAHPLRPDIIIPLYVVNYVKGNYGTGAVMGVPWGDARDAEFAQLHALPCVQVTSFPEGLLQDDPTQEVKMINSGPLDGMRPLEARKHIITLLEEGGYGKGVTTYRLNDWGIGRQRYWGVPIPIIHCKVCGIVPVPAAQLPVILPEDVTFDVPGNPLQRHPTWKHVACPTCGAEAQRETDTFDTFMESSWYFARFCDIENETAPIAPDIASRWLPVNQYVGGIEHAILHLLYARFFTRVMAQEGYWQVQEPFTALLTQGMVCHKTFKDQEGKWLYPQEVNLETECHHVTGRKVQVGRSEKMSKSKNNVVDVTQMVDTYGADTLRLFLLSDTPPQKDLDWSEEGVESAWRYVRRLWTIMMQHWHTLESKGWAAHMGALHRKNSPFANPSGDLHETPSAVPLATGTHKENACSESAQEHQVEALRPGEDAHVDTLMYAAHSAIRSISAAIESYALNKAVAHLRQLSNAIEAFPAPTSQGQAQALCESLAIMVKLMAPFVPHLAEEIAQQFGWPAPLHQWPWPQEDARWTVRHHVTLAVQINGKMRTCITAPMDSTQDTIETLLRENAKVQSYLGKNSWKRIILVPNRIVNILL